jgi:hydroxymethylbilane synthase
MTPLRRLVRIGTRGSRLARWQANWVADRLRELHPGLEVALVEIKTHGDRDRTSPLSAIGGMGLFTKEIQRALLDRSVEIAVHSLKDLPTRGPQELVLGAVPPREDPADALIAPVHLTLEALPAGARIGTGSQRRRGMLRYARHDLTIVDLRGNVETRIAAATEGRLDAVVLAASGLNRLGLSSHVTQHLGPPHFVPAVGQGALGIECRADDAETRALLAPLNDPATHRAILAERRVLFELEGGCTIPLAAWAREESGRLWLDAAVYDPESPGKIHVSIIGEITDPDGLGHQAADRLLQLGAKDFFRTATPS